MTIPMGKLTADNLPFFREKILSILHDGGQKREIEEWFFFYDKQNRYQGYCLKSDWEGNNDVKEVID
jgi:hypothetical protein